MFDGEIDWFILREADSSNASHCVVTVCTRVSVSPACGSTPVPSFAVTSLGYWRSFAEG